MRSVTKTHAEKNVEPEPVFAFFRITHPNLYGYHVWDPFFRSTPLCWSWPSRILEENLRWIASANLAWVQNGHDTITVKETKVDLRICTNKVHA